MSYRSYQEEMLSNWPVRQLGALHAGEHFIEKGKAFKVITKESLQYIGVVCLDTPTVVYSWPSGRFVVSVSKEDAINNMCKRRQAIEATKTKLMDKK